MGTDGLLTDRESEDSGGGKETVPPVDWEGSSKALLPWRKLDGDEEGEVVLCIAGSPIDWEWGGGGEFTDWAVEGGLEKRAGKAVAPFDRWRCSGVGLCKGWLWRQRGLKEAKLPAVAPIDRLWKGDVGRTDWPGQRGEDEVLCPAVPPFDRLEDREVAGRRTARAIVEVVLAEKGGGVE